MLKCLIIISLLNSIVINAQFNSLYVGGFIGGGNIQSNSPSQFCLSTSVFVGSSTVFFEKFSFRMGYIYARKINYFLPENRDNKYYPYIHSINLKGITNQSIGSNLFLEEGIGFALLNDRIFKDIDEFSFGLSFSAMIGWDMREINNTGLRLGINAEFTQTFTNTTASFYLLTFQTIYYL
ncbi:hypothetical protein ACFLS9_07450 [Bacteroidota bacterium]